MLLKMKVNVALLIPLIYCWLNLVYGKDIVLDVSPAADHDDVKVKVKVLGTGARRYVYRPRKAGDRITTIKYNEAKVPVSDNMRLKEVTAFIKDGVLIQIRNPRYGAFSRNAGKHLYFAYSGSQFRSVEKTEFMVLFHKMTKVSITLDLDNVPSAVARRNMSKGRIMYKPRTSSIRVGKVLKDNKRIWPNGKETSCLFVHAIYQNRNGKESITIKCKDSKNKKHRIQLKKRGDVWLRPDETVAEPPKVATL